MKLDDIVKVIAKELGSPDLKSHEKSSEKAIGNTIDELNLLLKSESSQKMKFKMMGKKLGQLGYTVAIKKITSEGLKVFGVNRVNLIKLSDIESFEKANPRVKRPDRPQKVNVS